MKMQFDETTEMGAEEFSRTYSPLDLGVGLRLSDAYNSGRVSAKESLAILARAVEEVSSFDVDDPMDHLHRAIVAVKSRGDWPLEEKP